MLNDFSDFQYQIYHQKFLSQFYLFDFEELLL